MGRDGRGGAPGARWSATAAGVLLSMTFVSGLVDAVAFLAVGHLFVAMVTGNIMFLGFTLAGAPGHSAPELLTAVASFFAGAVVGAPPRRSPAPSAPAAPPGFAARSASAAPPAAAASVGPPASIGPPAPLVPVGSDPPPVGSGALQPGGTAESGAAEPGAAEPGGVESGIAEPGIAEPGGAERGGVVAVEASPRRTPALTATAYAALLVTGFVLALVQDVTVGSTRYAMVVVLGLAMGMQNATGRRLGVPEIPTNVLTTQLTMIAAGRWQRGGPDRSTRRRAAAPAVMLCGALVGAATYRAAGVPAPLALAALVAITVAVALATGRVRQP